MDGSFGYFRAGQQRKAERSKNKGKFDPGKTTYNSGKPIKSTKKLSKKELNLMIKELSMKQRKKKRIQLKILFVTLILISSLISLFLFF